MEQRSFPRRVPRWRDARSGLTLALLAWALIGVPPVSMAMQASPSSLSFSAIQGGSNPPSQNAQLSKGDGKPTTWEARANVPWAAVSPGSGSMGKSTTITINANVAGMAAGTYSGTITITSRDHKGTQRYTMIPVSFAVVAGSGSTSGTSTTATPIISLAPTSLSFAGMAGGSNPNAQSITVSNSGSGTLSWSAGDNAGWLTLTPTAGTNSGTMTAAANIAGLSGGTYSATVTVTASGATTKTIPVTLTLTTPTTGGATLTWTANTEPDLAGYKLYVGTQSGVYGPPIMLGNVTSHQITNLTYGITYFFSVTAIDTAGNESPHSAEVNKSIF